MPGKATIPIYHGDDFERMAELRREIDIAERKLAAVKQDAEESALSVNRLGDDDSESAKVADAKERLAAAKEAFSAFVDEAAGRAENWVLAPIGHQEFRELLKAHPPRVSKTTDDEGKILETIIDDDAAFVSLGISVNTETFPRALLTFVDPEDDEIRTVREPFESEATLRKRIKRLSSGEFETMWLRAYFLNSGTIADPKSSDFYEGARRSDVI